MKSWRLISLIPRLAVIYIYIYIYSQFFENQPNEICSHLSEKASKVRFFKPEKLQSHSNEGKGEEGKKKRREGKEGKKKAMPALPVFIKKTVSRKWSIWRYMNHVTVCPSVHIVRRPLFTCKPGWHFAFKRPRVLVIAWPTGLLVWIRLQSCVYIHWRG